MSEQLTQPRGGADKAAGRRNAPTHGTIYDDLPFQGERIAIKAPPPVEVRDFPLRFSLLHLLALMTVVGLVCTLFYRLGFQNGSRLAILLTAIALYFCPFYNEWNADRRRR